VALVAAQRADVQLVEIWELVQVRVRLVAVVLAVLATPLGAHRLYALLVVVADVDVLRGWVAAQLQALLGHRLLDAFGVAGIAGLVATPLHVVDQAAGLIRVPAAILLARAESVVHPVRCLDSLPIS